MLIPKFEGRPTVFKALVGSHNYNLNDEQSDKDYKYFVMPTFDDMYAGKMFSTSKVGQVEDYDVHDIRKCIHLWWQANINFIEVLYTSELHLFDDIPGGDILPNCIFLTISPVGIFYRISLVCGPELSR